MTGSACGPLDLPCGEQGKQPTAKAFKLAERDKFMSEQEKPKSFMEELDEWTEATIIGRLAELASEDFDEKLVEEKLPQQMPLHRSSIDHRFPFRAGIDRGFAFRPLR